jgi:hypothetical protein
MDTVCVSETLVSSYESTRRQNPEQKQRQAYWKLFKQRQCHIHHQLLILIKNDESPMYEVEEMINKWACFQQQI